MLYVNGKMCRKFLGITLTIGIMFTSLTPVSALADTSSASYSSTTQGTTNSSAQTNIDSLIIKDNLPYDRAVINNEGFITVAKDKDGNPDKFGLIDNNGNEVVSPVYDYMDKVSEGMVKVGQDLDGNPQTGDVYGGKGIDKYGFVDTKGNVVVPLQYDRVDNFSEGLAAVYVNHSYKDSNLVPGFTVTVKSSKIGFVDKTGKEVIPTIYDNISSIHVWSDMFSSTTKTGFSEDVVGVEKDGKWGVIDTQGNTVIPFEFERIEGFSDGLAVIYSGGKHGYIDMQGNIIIPADYDIARNFSGGYAIVGKNSGNQTLYGAINQQGTIVVPMIYPNMHDFAEGMACVSNSDNRYGFVDTTGELVVPMIYDRALKYSNGLALVRVDDKRISEKQGKYGYIDKQGNAVIPLEYSYAKTFSNGLALADMGVPDHNGNGSGIIASAQFKKLGINPTYNYIDTAGNVVISMGSNNTEIDFSGNIGLVIQPNRKYAIIRNPVGGTDPVGSNQLKASTKSRLAGNDRYQTAVAISKSDWAKSDNVILANGTNFPDALVGSSFAYSIDAPILLTPSNTLDSSTKAEIERLGAKNIYILGNNESVSQTVQGSLSGYNVVRIGGTDVLDTAVKVGEKLRETTKFDTVVISTEENFPDSLAIAPFSAKYAMPILFSEKDKLRDDTKKALQDWGIKKVIITGGTAVVSSAVESELNSMGITVTRLAGNDRYDTCLEIVKHFEAQSGGYSQISIATGNDYPDSLSGAVLAAKNNTPLILVNKDTVKSNVAQYINAKSISKAFIFGGTAVVSDNVVNN